MINLFLTTNDELKFTQSLRYVVLDVCEIPDRGKYYKLKSIDRYTHIESYDHYERMFEDSELEKARGTFLKKFGIKAKNQEMAKKSFEETGIMVAHESIIGDAMRSLIVNTYQYFGNQYFIYQESGDPVLMGEFES